MEPTRLKKRIIITQGGKGGPGKTTVAKGLIDFLDSQKCSRIIIDADPENVKHGSLSLFFPEAKKVDITAPEGLDNFIDAAFYDDSEVVVADLGAGSGRATFDWFDKMYEPVSESGVRFLAIGVVTAATDTVEAVLHWAEALTDRVDYLIVKNYRNGRQIGGLDKFLKLSQAPVIELEARLEKLQLELDARGLTLASALESPFEIAGPILSLSSSRMRIRGYLTRMNAQFETVLDRLLP